MKKYVLLLGVVLMVLSGCASTPKVVPSATVANGPSWIDNPELPDMITGVGSSQPNPLGDKSLQRQTAIANARVELAKNLRVRVQNMFTQLTQQSTNASNQTGGNFKSDVASRMTESVTRDLTNQELTGSVIKQTWTDPTDGTLYVLVVVGKASIDQALGQIAKSEIQRDIDNGDQNLQGALGRLDDAISETSAGSAKAN